MILKNAFKILILLIILPFAYAELLISPIAYDGTVFVDKEKNAEIELNNTFSFTIHNINFSNIDYATIPLIDEIAPNQSKKINITVLTDETFSKKSFNSVVKFWYYTDINLEPKTHQVNITESNFTPYSITIRSGDSIEFNNIGTVFASIKDDYSPYKYFDIEVPANTSTIISTFNQGDDFIYRDWNIYKEGNIIIENATQELTNNPEYNKVFTLSFDSKYKDSELKLELYPDSNLSMEYNEFQEINLRIWNDGNETIHNVTLDTDSHRSWFEFEENHFKLDKNQNRYIDIRITPQINESDETNKTYEINIEANAENAEKVITTLKIFIPFSEEIQRIYYGSDFWEAKEKFCEKYPNALECNPPPKIEIVEKIIEKNSTIEYSKEEALKNDREQNRRLSNIETDQTKFTKSINEMTQEFLLMANNFHNITSLMSEYNNISKKSQKQLDESKTNFYLFVLLVIIIAFGLSLVYFLKWRKRRELSKP